MSRNSEMTLRIFVIGFLSFLVNSIPIRENAHWTMLLCKFRNNSFIPHSKDWFENWLTAESLDGTIASYLHQVSNGLYSIAESKVFDWFELPYTKQELYNLSLSDAKYADYPDPIRKLYLKTKETCSDYARNQFKIDLPSPHHVITVINDEDTAVFCKEHGVLVAPRFVMTAAVSHEMVHSFFLGHSYSDVNVKVFSYAQVGEYDDRYDLMSTANAYMFESNAFGSSGPGLNGPHLDFLGWLPSDRVYLFGKDGNNSYARSIRLSSLSRPHSQTKEWLLILIPYDRDDPQKVYTVELRTKEFLDYGIPKSAVVVHQIFRQNGFLFSKILNQGGRGPDYELDAGAEWLVFLDHHGSKYIRLRVDWINALSATAQVSIFSSFSPTNCKKGETQRLAYSGDLQCVSLSEHEAAQTQNQKNRIAINGQCPGGYYLREAGPGDSVCVNSSDKEMIRQQNERWRSYANFYDQPTFGLNSCKKGLVWRKIDAYDYVCVETSRRREIDQQNAEDRLKRATILSDCFGHFVFRGAFPNDDVCVSEQERGFIEFENSKKIERLLYPKFFNGEDKVE